MSADMNFAAYVGTDGLCLKDWHYNARAAQLSKVVLSTSEWSIAIEMNALLVDNFRRIC